MDKWYQEEEKEAEWEKKQAEICQMLSLKVRIKEFDEQYLSLIDELNGLSGDLSLVYYYASLLALYNNDIKTAKLLAENAYKIHKYDVKIWKLLVMIYDRIDKRKSATFKGLCRKYADLHIGTDLDVLDNAEDRAYKCGTLDVSLAPFTCALYDNKWGYKVEPGSYLVTEGEDEGEFRYYIGLYNPDGAYNMQRKRLDYLDKQNERDVFVYSNITFDVIRAKHCKQLNIETDVQKKFILQLAATKEKQDIRVLINGENYYLLSCGQNEFRMLRLEENAIITSNHDFAIAKPVVLCHAKQRKKLVLNILLDGLSWSTIKRNNYEDMPNLMNFFKPGIIFDNAYSVAEYTYPSLATIETGMYMHNSQITVEHKWSQLSENIVTTSEHMRDLGYYCCNVMGDSRGMYNGVTRGFDKLLVSPYLEHLSYEGVKRTIDHLDAFSECDNYVFLHVSDAHPFNYLLAPLQIPTQTNMKCQEVSFVEKENITTVALPSYGFMQRDNRYMIRRLDSNLKLLFDYIEKNYAENEYIVNAYSDHGVSIYSDNPYYFDDNQCNTALLIRGDKIPQLGHVNELVSAMDIHKIMGREVGFSPTKWQQDGNLPSALGGKEREYVFSNSIYPGQTYKLCIRSCEYECRIESRKPTREDGSIDLSEYKIDIYRRNSNHEAVYDDALQEKFMGMAYDFTRSFRNI